MKPWVPGAASLFATLVLTMSALAIAAAQDKAPSIKRTGPAALPTETIAIVYLGKAYEEPPPLSLLEKILTDEGVAGARLGIEANNTTGRFLGHRFVLQEEVVPADGDVVARAKEVLAKGDAFIIADLAPEDLLAVADLPEAQGSIIINIRSARDDLREEQCRANVFHVIPSYFMKADALAQYLIWKRWNRWFLVKGTTPEDQAYAEAVKRAAKRFGGKVVEERTFKFEAGQRRTDSGHQQIQTQMPVLTQGAEEHDVIWVADVGEAFGDYLMYRTYETDPVVGTQGLVAAAWHRAYEQYAGTQLQNAFEEFANRIMTERDYEGWLAARVIGEAATRTRKIDVASLRDFIRSDEFKVAGFKGQQLTFRPWDNQLRQPVLIAGPRALVSMSPQDGFLHEKFPADTLGVDGPETKCKFTP
jgi:ABC transporter substrate binding protein (PQQ-dependent alcohol dehydrogenase system)